MANNGRLIRHCAHPAKGMTPPCDCEAGSRIWQGSPQDDPDGWCRRFACFRHNDPRSNTVRANQIVHLSKRIGSVDAAQSAITAARRDRFCQRVAKRFVGVDLRGGIEKLVYSAQASAVPKASHWNSAWRFTRSAPRGRWSSRLMYRCVSLGPRRLFISAKSIPVSFSASRPVFGDKASSRAPRPTSSGVATKTSDKVALFSCHSAYSSRSRRRGERTRGDHDQPGNPSISSGQTSPTHGGCLRRGGLGKAPGLYEPVAHVCRRQKEVWRFSFRPPAFWRADDVADWSDCARPDAP